MTCRSIVSKALIAVFSFTLIAPSFAATFQEKHPRRAEVNQREENQKKRIRKGVKNGTITKDEAKADRQNLKNVKREERADVKANGGHLTKSEQKDLNQQLNKNSQQIHEEKHEEKHDGSVTPPPAPEAPAAGAPTAQ